MAERIKLRFDRVCYREGVRWSILAIILLGVQYGILITDKQKWFSGWLFRERIPYQPKTLVSERNATNMRITETRTF